MMEVNFTVKNSMRSGREKLSNGTLYRLPGGPGAEMDSVTMADSKFVQCKDGGRGGGSYSDSRTSFSN